MKQSEKSDFRYNTGDAKVPWDAVAVKPDPSLVMDVVRFLIGPGTDAGAYATAARKVEGAVEELYRHGQPATKLSLGAQVKAVGGRRRRRRPHSRRLPKRCSMRSHRGRCPSPRPAWRPARLRKESICLQR